MGIMPSHTPPVTKGWYSFEHFECNCFQFNLDTSIFNFSRRPCNDVLVSMLQAVGVIFTDTYFWYRQLILRKNPVTMLDLSFTDRNANSRCNINWHTSWGSSDLFVLLC